MSNIKISIIGAGIGGVTAAIALARVGAEVTVFEQAEQLGEVGAGIQLSPNAMKVLAALGVADEVEEAGFAPKNAAVRHWQTGAAYMKLPLRDACRAAYGAPYVHIHRADLHGILTKAARTLGVRFCLGCFVEGYKNDGPDVAVLADGKEMPCDLIVGADGVRSVIGAQMNPKDDLRFTGQVAWRGCVAAQDLPVGMIQKDATVWAGPGRHFVAYYLRGGEMVNFVAVEERDDWKDDSWTCEGDASALRAAFAGWDAPIQEILGAVDKTFLWALYDRAEVARWSDGAVVLMGDACHPTLPFMAQGAAMAIEDGLILAQSLQESASVGDGLQWFEAVRKPRTSWLQQRARDNAGLFHLHGFGSGMVPRAKLRIAGLLPNRIGLLPFDKIYGFDAVKRDT